MTLATGTRLGPYEILAPIGAGGMGEVYKARDTRLDRLVAVKVSQERFSARFEREARAVAALNHPHICTLYDVGPNYLVMELVEGAELKGPLPVERAVEYAGQILDALDAAHHRGIVHRDLKPANILVTKQGVKLLDFGLAKLRAAQPRAADETVTKALTGQGQITGTLQYMSPEQLQSKEADARSDLFSFGCVLYEMLSGKRAFAGESTASVVAAILEREPAPLTVALPLERIIRRSLAKDPDQRFQTARDLKAALLWAMEQPPPQVAAKPARRRWILTAVLIIAALLAGWGAVRLSQRPAETGAYRLQLNPPEGGRMLLGNNIGGIALAPDGRTAAYVASGSGTGGLWVRRLDEAEARLIAGTEAAASPFWSPDGKSIGFFIGSKLLRVELAGGAPTVLCNVPVARGGAWTSDGRILCGTLADGLYQVPASGGTPSPFTRLNSTRGEIYHRWPKELPGGRFLYSVQSGRPEHSGIFAASFDNPNERRRLVACDTNALYAPGGDGHDYLLYLRGATLVAQQFNTRSLKIEAEPQSVVERVARIGILGLMNAAASGSGLLLYGTSNVQGQFSWFDRSGKSLAVVGEPGEYSTFRLSLDARRLVAARDGASTTDLWLLDVERGISGRLTSYQEFTTYPVWSPDGRTIVFSFRMPRNLFQRDASGGGSEERFTQSPNNQFAADWSRDGRWVIYTEVSPGTERDLWVRAATPDGRPAPGVEPRVYLKTPFNERTAAFSPESPPRWVAYQSDDTGRNEIYIRSFPEPGGATRISTGGGQYPRWGDGGREIYYVSPDAKLMVVKLKPGAGAPEPSTPAELFPLPTDETGWCPYDVADDGRRFLVLAMPGQGQPLTAVVNWPALMKKAAP